MILQHFPEFLKHLDGVVAHANQCNGRLELALTSQNQEANAFLDSIRVFKISTKIFFGIGNFQISQICDHLLEEANKGCAES